MLVFWDGQICIGNTDIVFSIISLESTLKFRNKESRGTSV